MATTDTLPVPAEAARTYFRVRPTKDVINPATFAVHARRLYDSLATDTHRFRRTPPSTLLEVLVVVDAEGTLSYVLGVTDAARDETLERTLRSSSPNATRSTASPEPHTG